MKQKRMKFLLAVLFSLALTLPAWSAQAATTITSNQTGTQDGYDYELWKDSGNTSMTLNSGGAFSAQWSNIGNALFRKGKKFDSTKTHSQLGNISINYNATFNPGGIPICVFMDGRKTRSQNITSSIIGAPTDRRERRRVLLLLMGAHMTFMRPLESTNLPL